MSRKLTAKDNVLATTTTLSSNQSRYCASAIPLKLHAPDSDDYFFLSVATEVAEQEL